jgi:hypothetical protein
LDFWSPEQTKKFIGIERAFAEFCEADSELAILDSTKPDPERNPKKFEKWYARCWPVMDDATRRFVELFREEILVAMALHDDKEVVLPSEYWAIPVASLTVAAGKVQGLSPDDPDGHLENSRVVLLSEDWEEWKAKQGQTQYEPSADMATKARLPAVVEPTAGRRPASQSGQDKIHSLFDDYEPGRELKFYRGELAKVARDIAKQVDYKPNSVEKVIRPRYRELETKHKNLKANPD